MLNIALSREINVGGAGRLPMADLREVCAWLGWRDLRTYLQSGDVVFEAEGTPDSLNAVLRQALPFDWPVLVIEAEDFNGRVAACPFQPEAGNLVHAHFCTDVGGVDHGMVADLRTDEDVAVLGNTVWLHTPSGFSRSKLALRFDRVLGDTDWTARNLKTLHKLVDMCGG